MATTRESILDGLRWCAKLLRIFAKRAAITGVIVAALATVVVFTTRERVSDCSRVTPAQDAVLAELTVPGSDRSFRATAEPRCVEGVFQSPLSGVPMTLESATAQLRADGWALETEFLPFFDQLWRRCFSIDTPGWERIQINIDAVRAGDVVSAAVIAPEEGDACEAERREFSDFYPPGDS